MENVSIPVSGEKYVWVKNKDTSKGKVVLHTLSLLGVVSPKVISGGVEEYVSNVPDNGNFFLSWESVEEWGYDIREYSAYTIEDTPKYVWYTGGSEPKVLFRYKDNIYVGALGTQDAKSLVGITKYMFSEEELENSVFDPDKFLAVGDNGLLVRGDTVGEVVGAPTRRPEYKMSEEFYKLHDKDILAITIDNKVQADILTGLLPIDGEYRACDSEGRSSEALVVYPEQAGYGADFTMMRHLGKYKIMSFAEAVVELSPATFSTDGDASDVISAPYDTTNGIAIDLSGIPLGTDELPSAGITSAKINLVWYKTTDKFKEALSKGTVLIPVEDAIEAAILGTVFEIDPGYKYNDGYSTVGDSALIVSNGLPAMFGPYLSLPGTEEIAFGDAVEGDSAVPYTSF